MASILWSVTGNMIVTGNIVKQMNFQRRSLAAPLSQIPTSVGPPCLCAGACRSLPSLDGTGNIRTRDEKSSTAALHFRCHPGCGGDRRRCLIAGANEVTQCEIPDFTVGGSGLNQMGALNDFIPPPVGRPLVTNDPARPKVMPYGEPIGHYEAHACHRHAGVIVRYFHRQLPTPHTTQEHVFERCRLDDSRKTLWVDIRIKILAPSRWHSRRAKHSESAESFHGQLLDVICSEDSDVLH